MYIWTKTSFRGPLDVKIKTSNMLMSCGGHYRLFPSPICGLSCNTKLNCNQNKVFSHPTSQIWAGAL